MIIKDLHIYINGQDEFDESDIITSGYSLENNLLTGKVRLTCHIARPNVLTVMHTDDPTEIHETVKALLDSSPMQDRYPSGEAWNHGDSVSSLFYVIDNTPR